MSARRWPLEKIMPGTKMRPVLFLNHHMQSACVVYLLVCIRAAAGIDSSVHVACAPHCRPGVRPGMAFVVVPALVSVLAHSLLYSMVSLALAFVIRRCWHSSLLAFVVVGSFVIVGARRCWH
jgi:hypothetical protein